MLAGGNRSNNILEINYLFKSKFSIPSHFMLRIKYFSCNRNNNFFSIIYPPILQTFIGQKKCWIRKNIWQYGTIA